MKTTTINVTKANLTTISLAVISLAIVIFMSINTYAEIPTENLVAYFPFENSANDVVAEHTGDITGDITYVKGKVGNAALFNGESFISVAGEDFALSSWTLSFWVFVDKTGAKAYSPVCKRAINGDYYKANNYSVEYAANGSIFSSYRSCDFQCPDRIGMSKTLVTRFNGNTGRWFHWVYTKAEEGEQCLYLNGILLYKKDNYSTPPCDNPDTPFLIGGKLSETGHSLFQGMIDELRVYDVALSSQQVRDIVADSAVCQVSEELPEEQSGPCEFTVEMLDEKVAELNLAYDPTGAIHAYPNILKKNRNGRTVILEGYIVDKLASLREGHFNVIKEAYAVIASERHDLLLDGNSFELETSIPAIPGTIMPVELWAIDLFDNVVLVDTTRIKVKGKHPCDRLAKLEAKLDKLEDRKLKLKFKAKTKRHCKKVRNHCKKVRNHCKKFKNIDKHIEKVQKKIDKFSSLCEEWKFN